MQKEKSFLPLHSQPAQQVPGTNWSKAFLDKEEKALTSLKKKIWQQEIKCRTLAAQTKGKQKAQQALNKD